jgi:hypothetical protein
LIIDLGRYWLPQQHFAAKVNDQGLASTNVTAHAGLLHRNHPRTPGCLAGATVVGTTARARKLENVSTGVGIDAFLARR